VLNSSTPSRSTRRQDASAGDFTAYAGPDAVLMPRRQRWFLISAGWPGRWFVEVRKPFVVRFGRQRVLDQIVLPNAEKFRLVLRACWQSSGGRDSIIADVHVPSKDLLRRATRPLHFFDDGVGLVQLVQAEIMGYINFHVANRPLRGGWRGAGRGTIPAAPGKPDRPPAEKRDSSP